MATSNDSGDPRIAVDPTFVIAWLHTGRGSAAVRDPIVRVEVRMDSQRLKLAAGR
jgi:hypothetical protein